MSMQFYEKFIQILKARYPLVAENNASFAPQMISNHVITMNRLHLQDIESAIQAIQKARESQAWKQKIKVDDQEVLNLSLSHFSVLMSYDFYITESGPKLIEINTNASFAPQMQLLNEMHHLTDQDTPGASNILNELKNTFLKDFGLFSHRPLKTIAIIDENAFSQKLIAEFYIYKNLFLSWGVSDVIIGSPEDFQFDVTSQMLQHKKSLAFIDLVYNRHTDFLFSTPECKDLRAAFLSKQTCFSPSPREYLLLADKARLMDLSNTALLIECGLHANEVAAIQKVIEPIYLVKSKDPEVVWAERKELFFKPTRSFGGKATYKGASLSRKVFQQILDGDYLAQKYITPLTTSVALPDGAQDFKYDVRCYVYRNQLQLLGARLFQGQVTNFQTLGGGFACVKLTSRA